MPKHMRYECKHGRMIAQCRCPSKDKIIRVGDCFPDCPVDDGLDKQDKSE